MSARLSSAAAALFVSLWVAAPAAAQPRRPAPRPPALGPAPARVVIDLSGGTRRAGPAFSDRLEFETNVETATVDVNYPSATAVVLNGGAAFRLWKQVGLGFAVSNATRTGAAALDGQIPDPFLFNQPRTLTGSPSGLTRNETAVHLQVLYVLPLSRAVTLTLSAGPTLARVRQDLVTAVRYDEAYPYDAVTFRSVATTRASASAAGGHAGADVRWMFSRALGAGALVRYSNATVHLPASATRTLDIRAGGVEALAGLRLVF